MGNAGFSREAWVGDCMYFKLSFARDDVYMYH